MDKPLAFLKNLGVGKNVIFLGLAALGVAALVVYLLWSKGPEYQVLFSNLSAEDSGTVIEKLREKRIPYKVDGTVISVPLDKVYETRMELAGEGLPQGGGVGFEIFDKTGFGVTEFVQKVNYKRALQGELARTISQIKEVETARVHIAMPEKGVFLDEQKKSRASIILKLKPGKSLTAGQVSAIVHLVANSFENLKPEDITVVDTAGRMWTSANSADDNVMGLSAGQLEYKRSMEKDLETRIQSMLEKAVGADKVVARVSADLDNKQVERTEETFDPDSQVVRSEQRNKERSTGGTTAVGVPGVLSNMPDGSQKPGASTAATAVSTPSQSQRQNEVVNYEINKVVSRVIEPVGSIKRMTVSVLVDGAYETSKGADGKEVRKYVPRTDEEIKKFTEMVKGAVGFSDKRGDAITVLSAPFEADQADGGAEAEKASFISNIASKQPYLLPVAIKYATILTIVLAAFLVVLRPILKRFNEESAALQAIEKSLPEGYASPELPAGVSKEDRDQVESLKALVRKDPQQVATIIKSWIKER